ncbi:MAG: Do family serine endopeptidase [Prevotella sp.]|nr:Do family serine endopeptidase [Prevotella sp.]MDD4533160.1 Do family serine endopeptidase [Prevotella sp.]
MKKISNYLVAGACVVALAFSAGALAKVYATTNETTQLGQPVDLTYASDKALPAVVHIKYVKNSTTKTVDVQSNPFDDFFGDPFGFFGNPGGNGGTQKRQVRTPKMEATGSGVIISSDGYIVTNNHVVDGADELTVTLEDNREFNARIIGTDPTTDLALIKIDGKNLPTLPIGDSDKIKVGEWVIAVGNPFGFNNTVTAGIVSAKARTLGQNGVESFIQTDAAINKGNSGGALVNTKGELIGINAMLFSETGSYSGYGFAIPTSIMNKVVADLKEYGTVQRAYLGIKGQDVLKYLDSQKVDGKEAPDLGTNAGVYVAEVEDNSAGADAGLKTGDVITGIDGKDVTKMAELQEIINSKRPGDKATITWMRNKKTMSKTVTMKNNQGNTKVVKKAGLDVLGANVAPVSDKLKTQLGISYGLQVQDVKDGAFKDGGINDGYIILNANDQPMRTIEDLQNVVKEASMSKNPVLFITGVWPSGKTDYKAIKVGQD